MLLTIFWIRPIRMTSPIWGPTSGSSTQTEKHLIICLTSQIFFKYFFWSGAWAFTLHARFVSTWCGLQWEARETTSALSTHRSFCSVSCDNDAGPLSLSFIKLTRGGENTPVFIRFPVEAKRERQRSSTREDEENMWKPCVQHLSVSLALWPFLAS